MQLRRNLLMQQESYIKNGLVLWMDGIDKGNISGSWVDKVSGYEFVGNNSPIFGENYVQTGGANNSCLINTTFIAPADGAGTIEIVAEDYSMSSNQIIYMPNYSGGIAFGIYKNTGIIWSTGNAKIVMCPYGFKTISINIDRTLSDLNDASFSETTNNWSGYDTNNYIGIRSTGTPFTGKIHAIRIYSRKLSKAEMLHNQKIDNKRFNLGITI